MKKKVKQPIRGQTSDCFFAAENKCYKNIKHKILWQEPKKTTKLL